MTHSSRGTLRAAQSAQADPPPSQSVHHSRSPLEHTLQIKTFQIKTRRIKTFQIRRSPDRPSPPARRRRRPGGDPRAGRRTDRHVRQDLRLGHRLRRGRDGDQHGYDGVEFDRLFESLHKIGYKGWVQIHSHKDAYGDARTAAAETFKFIKPYLA